VSARAGPDGGARIDDPSEAGTIYGRGFFGTLGSPGLTLAPPEAVYLAEMERLAVVDDRDRSLSWTDLFRRANRSDPRFPVEYLVYRDLRQRGYVVRESPPPTRFAVLPRGGILQKTPARFWVQPLSERSPFDLAAIGPLFERAHAARKTLLLAVVDEESDLTYYRVTGPIPQGAHPVELPSVPADALVSSDRVLVTEPAAVEALGRTQGFGSRIGRRLELSLVEASFLAERGALTLRSAGTHRPLDPEQLRARARRVDPAFELRRAAYAWLRGRGLIVKTGFKYGAHFRAYVRDPEHTHARYLLEAVRPDHTAPWPAIAGHVRLAQGVRKDLLLAIVPPDGAVRCLALERIRP
jgi:tRNA-intron endonuclease